MPDLAYVFGGVLFLAVLLVGWIIGDLRSAPREAGQTFTNVLWERSRFSIADQQALAEFLSADYDERAEVIYLVTSGYSVNGGPASDLRMNAISVDKVQFKDSNGKKVILAVTKRTKFCDEKGNPLPAQAFKAGEGITTATSDEETVDFVQKGPIVYSGGMQPSNGCK